MKQIKRNFFNILLLGCILFTYNTTVSGQVGINTSTPKSTLDITSPGSATTDVAGVQGSRLDLAELTAKGNTLYGADQTGAIIYITNVSGGNNTGQRLNITALGYYYFDGALWQKLNTPQPVVRDGDIMQSFKASDYDGWYLLDGRALSSLPDKAKAAAVSLGFTTNLPDARDRVLKTKDTSEGLASIGGTNSMSITRANLPDISLSGSITGTLASAGAHTHTASSTLDAGGAHNHTVNGNLAAGGEHSHITSGNLAAGGAHTHAFSGTLASAGTHLHDLSPVIYVMPGTAKDVDRGYGAGTLWSYIATSTYTTSSSGNHNHTISSTLAAGGRHTHPVSGTLASADGHTHAVTGALAADGAHAHEVTASLASTGAHTHTASGSVTLPLGGAQAAMDNRSAYLVVNTFIYLGL